MRRLWCALLALILVPSLALAQGPREKHDDFKATGSVVLNVLGLASASIQVSGTFDATVTFAVSNDNTNWEPIACEAPTGAEGVSETTSTGLWFCPVAGAMHLRANVSIYTSGTVTVNMASASGGRAPLVVGATGTIDANIVGDVSTTVSNLVPTSAPTYAVSPCTIVTTASTNATVCADAPANVYGVYYAINTTTTPAFMRVTNDASSITCTDTPVFVVPIPASSDTGVYGGVALPWVNPINFTTGVGVCVTSGADGTGNAPAGIIILLAVKE